MCVNYYSYLKIKLVTRYILIIKEYLWLMYHAKNRKVAINDFTNLQIGRYKIFEETFICTHTRNYTMSPPIPHHHAH